MLLEMLFLSKTPRIVFFSKTMNCDQKDIKAAILHSFIDRSPVLSHTELKLLKHSFASSFTILNLVVHSLRGFANDLFEHYSANLHPPDVSELHNTQISLFGILYYCGFKLLLEVKLMKTSMYCSVISTLNR